MCEGPVSVGLVPRAAGPQKIVDGLLVRAGVAVAGVSGYVGPVALIGGGGGGRRATVASGSTAVIIIAAKGVPTLLGWLGRSGLLV